MINRWVRVHPSQWPRVGLGKITVDEIQCNKDSKNNQRVVKNISFSRKVNYQLKICSLNSWLFHQVLFQHQCFTKYCFKHCFTQLNTSVVTYQLILYMWNTLHICRYQSRPFHQHPHAFLVFIEKWTLFSKILSFLTNWVYFLLGADLKSNWYRWSFGCIFILCCNMWLAFSLLGCLQLQCCSL